MELNLSECEKEQIHTPQLIQPHGYAIVFDKKTQLVTRCSQNLDLTYIGSIKNILGHPIAEILPNDLCITVTKKLDFSTYKRHTIYNTKITTFSEYPLDIIVCEAREEIILELIPITQNIEEFSSIDFQLNEIVRKVITTQQMSDLFEVAANEIKTLTKYDRVMIYQFDKEYNGEVIAEAREKDMESYLNLHYPASDIPAQARELYRKNTIRIIMDNEYKPVPVINYSDELELLDMSYSYLRSVSPIHLEYLHNMGVKATLTISIMVNNKLWGLISCHHRTPFTPIIKRLNLVEIFGNILGGIIQMREESETEKRNSELLARLDVVIEMLLLEDKSPDLLDLIKRKIYLFQSIFHSDGFLVYVNNSIIAHNFPFSETQIIQLINQLEPLVQDKIFYTDNLASIFDNLPEIILKMCAGLMVLKLDTQPISYWIWRRAEKTQTIYWGGNPYQKAIMNQQGIISPRKSFEKYNQIVTKKSVSWDRSEQELYIYLIPRLYRLFEFFESTKEIESHKQHILHIEKERAKHFEELIEMLVGVIEMRDAYTGGHTRRVADYSVAIANELDIDKESINQLKEAAILHDIGKVIIPDSILLKPGRLSYKEYELIKQHVVVGHQILDKIDYYKPLAQIVRYHHEKFDGSGYPDGKKADEIPFLSHIMIVADAFDAMTTNRIYQPRKSVEDAILELIKYRGIWYNPDVVDAAIKMARKLQSMEPSASQLPFTQIEKERFSYFFKDQLTGIYNDTYLWMTINDLIPGMRYNYFLLIELHGMTEYNARFGWNKGNQIIQEFAQSLIKQAKEEQLFRVFGDDFIVGFDSSETKATFIESWNSLQIENVYSICKSIEKNMFIEIL
jgi:putative nucleotidyltransferase with HDIG domain